MRITAAAMLSIAVVMYWYWRRADAPLDVSSLTNASIERLLDSAVDRLRSTADALQEIPGQESRVNLLQGIIALKSGALNVAVYRFNAAASDPDIRAVSLGLLGQSLVLQRRHGEAIRVLEACLTLDSRNINARRWLCAALYDVGAMDLAKFQLAVVAEQDPDDPRPNRLRGLIDKDFERYTSAITEYQESLRRDPDQPDHEQIRLELVECQLELHQYEDALQTLAGLPRSVDSCVLQAQCARALNRHTEASELVEDALKLAPAHTGALIVQARLLEDEGDYAGACEHLRRVVELEPGEFDHRFLLANAYRQLGRVEDAQREWEHYKRLHDLSLEFAELHTTAFTDFENAELRCRLGDIARELHRFEIARVWYEAALGIDPDHERARALLRELLRRQATMRPTSETVDGGEKAERLADSDGR